MLGIILFLIPLAIIGVQRRLKTRLDAQDREIRLLRKQRNEDTATMRGIAQRLDRDITELKKQFSDVDDSVRVAIFGGGSTPVSLEKRLVVLYTKLQGLADQITANTTSAAVLNERLDALKAAKYFEGQLATDCGGATDK